MWAVAVIATYVILGIVLLSLAHRPGPVVPGFTAFFAAGVFIAEIATSFLLFVRFRATPTWSILVLAAAYLYSASLTVPYLLTFPGALVTDQSVIGSSRSTAWIFIPWIFGFAALTLAAFVLQAVLGDRPLLARRIRTASAATVGLTLLVLGAVIYNALATVQWMPMLIDAQGHWTEFDRTISYSTMAMLAGGIAVVLIFIRERSELFLWLGLALTAMLLSNLLSTFGGARFTIGWTASRLSWVVSGSALFLYFLLQFARQQRLLARARDALEQNVSERTADLTKTVKQRDLLLREVHHRVKNNFQVVNSLIHFQASHANDPETRAALTELHGRVSALGLVHKQLMQSEDLATFDLRAFLDELCANVAAWARAAQRGIEMSIEADPIEADLDFAGPFGLLATELLTEAFRHFPDGERGVIRMSLRRQTAQTLALAITDDSAQPQASFISPTGGHEMRIRQALVAQLKGQVEGADDGRATTVVLRGPHSPEPSLAP